MHLFLYLVISDEFSSDISLWTAVQTMKLTDQKVWSLWILTIHIFSQSHQDFVKYTFVWHVRYYSISVHSQSTVYIDQYNFNTFSVHIVQERKASANRNKWTYLQFWKKSFLQNPFRTRYGQHDWKKCQSLVMWANRSFKGWLPFLRTFLMCRGFIRVQLIQSICCIFI